MDLVTTKCLLRPTRVPRHNQVPVQPNKRHALDLTCKHGGQVTDEETDRSKMALGLTAVLDGGGQARCSVCLMLPSDGVHFMNKVAAGSPINIFDQARNIFDVDGRGEYTHKPPTPSCKLPLAVIRLLPPLIVVSALLGGCNTTGLLPFTGSFKPGADQQDTRPLRYF